MTEQPLSGQESDEVLPGPVPFARRRWLALGTAAGVAVVAGGVAIGLASSSASASPASIAAAASSSAASSSSHPARPTGTDGRRPFAAGPFLFGSVKSVSGTKILITDAQGFTRTIITSAKTTYKDGLTASPAAGTKIVATGTVDSDGTSLDATTISAEPKLPEGGFRPGGGGAGGPGPRPTGTSTVKPTGFPTDHPGGFPGGRGPGGPGGHGGPTATPTATKTS